MLLRSLLAAQRRWPSSTHWVAPCICHGSLQGVHTAAAATAASRPSDSQSASSSSGTWWAAAGAAVMAAAAAAASPALADKSSALPPVSAVDPEQADGVVTGEQTN